MATDYFVRTLIPSVLDCHDSVTRTVKNLEAHPRTGSDIE
jgi:hypothetical protein